MWMDIVFGLECLYTFRMVSSHLFVFVVILKYVAICLCEAVDYVRVNGVLHG